MRSMNCAKGLVLASALLLGGSALQAQDWPQWRGPNRDARAAGFKVPNTWPKELVQKWKIAVGDGVATPALVGDKLFVFARQDGNEIIRCMNASDGKEVWSDKYEARAADGPAAGFAGPRSSPIVVDGKVVTLGVRGALSCYDAAKGTKIWRKDDFKGSVPRFCTSSSPMIVDGLLVAQLGSESSGGVVAYDLASGDEKWKWTGDGTAYASPSVLTIGDEKVIVAETSKKIVALGAKDGKLKWEAPFAVSGRGYNSASPMVDGETVIYAGSGRGTKAVKLEKKDAALAGKELWSNSDNSVIYNSPIIKNGMVFALSDKDSLFCINAEGKTAWTASIVAGKSRGRAGYGNIVDAGSVLMAITPAAELIVFEPTDKEFKEIARYKVSSAGSTYAYPVLSGNRIFVKDKDSLILWTTE